MTSFISLQDEPIKTVPSIGQPPIVAAPAIGQMPNDYCEITCQQVSSLSNNFRFTPLLGSFLF